MQKKICKIVEETLLPNWRVQTFNGSVQHVWDWRQKSKLGIIHEPQTNESIWQNWKQEILTQEKLWTWLRIEFARSLEDQSLEPGIYLADDYGHLIKFFPSTVWTFPKIEQELISYDACHCG